MKKILIANRGEIALRIIRTCKKMNIETIAVYSEADSNLPYVKQADSAFLIGPPPVAQSYLKAQEILDIAIKEGADAIHPGYGLLSENAKFAKMTEDAGIRFIGPDSAVIASMGDKIKARNTMIEAGVPVVPGQESKSADLESALTFAKKAGFPVMLKASNGGGGVGMVHCKDEQALTQHFESTKKRSESYFGSGDLFIEKYIPNARHIEVQIFGSASGEIYHLFERNCSIQRRNQKIIEESPSPNLSDDARAHIFKVAIQAAKAVNYRNAGTIEMIVDENENAYFLEMNTRLQVEHPVTEMITGIDLVEWQILTAQNIPVPVSDQHQIQEIGHAVEFRVYAEDPVTFYPSPGEMKTAIFPEGEGVRIDLGYEQGNKITPYYDPMIAKIIFSDQTREACLMKAEHALTEIQIEGVKTNIPLFQHVLKSEAFKRGNYHTQTLEQLKKGEN
ncbi:acetyl-CoA carboxylase biotin carboxylase subunit [Jeotgalibacillus proteolyticus]|uniref:acetyl-CoA carboxylase biotin carboxylase subunit n=1 Tax=Jeotgalibacillus proteolyticus TaxID=2082395 RepID=UPI003CFB0059